MSRHPLQMPEWAAIGRIRHFRISVELLQRNYQELNQLLVGIGAPPNPFSFLGTVNRWKRGLVLREVVFRLHNYVASALSLVDHSRILYRELYEKDCTFPEYTEAVT